MELTGPGALAQWRAEVRRNPGRKYDALQEAAGWEQAGLDAMAAGLPSDETFAAHCFKRAVEILTAASIRIPAATVDRPGSSAGWPVAVRKAASW